MPGSGPTEGLPVPSTDGSENGRSTCDFWEEAGAQTSPDPQPASPHSAAAPTLPAAGGGGPHCGE